MKIKPKAQWLFVALDTQPNKIVAADRRFVLPLLLPNPFLPAAVLCQDEFRQLNAVIAAKLTNTTTVVRRLIENVCRNGNYMLNISPKSDGTIPDEQKEILLGIGKWLDVNGEGIYSTRAWKQCCEGDFRFTKKGNALYAIILKWPTQPVLITALSTSIDRVQKVTMLGSKENILFTQDGQGLKLTFPQTKPCNHAWTLKIAGSDL